jgi:hypothetical protein
MKSRTARRLLTIVTLLAFPVHGFAQEASIRGTVTDTTGGVLPGVAITALHEASGNTFEAVTDERGEYRIPVRIGGYQITAQLQGFATTTRSGLQLLVGQQTVANFEMAPSALAETVTVTGEAPLVDTTSSTLGGNVDPRQVAELPIDGRNWMELALLAPGNRSNSVSEHPTELRGDVRESNVNLDGQQLSLYTGTTGNPRLSQDAIAEFQFTSRFDATQGRSSGVQVNAITKSGTNAFAGTFAGYFRNSRFMAEDFFTQDVLPYSNQQLSGTLGGPILRDRLHFFSNLEFQREPVTSVYRTPYPAFNITLTGTNTMYMGGGRLDYQISPRHRLMLRPTMATEHEPFSEGGSSHPAANQDYRRYSREVLASLTQVLSNRAVNEIKGGYASIRYYDENHTSWAQHPQAAAGITKGSPRITFNGFTIGGNASSPRDQRQRTYTLRDDFTTSFTRGGRHDVKLGAEALLLSHTAGLCRQCMGVVNAQNGSVPANIEALFPVWNDASTWNMAAISPNVRTYTQGVGRFIFTSRRPNYAAWVQDDWTISQRLTLNLGLRYDLIQNAWANSIEIPPLLIGDRPTDYTNFGPRLGFAYSVSDRTVLRGGWGLYYGDTYSNMLAFAKSFQNIAFLQVPNDGRPDFAANPFNGPIPNYDQAVALFCSVNGSAPGCIRRAALELPPYPSAANWPLSYQASVGFQRQIGDTMAFEADYVSTRSRNEKDLQDNINLTFNPATGVNYPFADISRRALPDWGTIGMTPFTRWSDYHGLQTAFTKRFSQRWQAGATYTLSQLKDGDPAPLSGLQIISFPVAADLGGEYGLAQSDQRHRAVFNGIWDAGYGFQLSGLYFYGSGQRFTTTAGGDRRDSGISGGRLRADGTITPRNNLIGDPVHRTDLRVQRKFQLGGGVSIDGLLEVFNVFNRANYMTYTTQESSSLYGQPSAHAGVRRLQFGFRAAF